VAAGVDPAADAVCFAAAFLTVPDDPRLRAGAGQGAANGAGSNYDPGMPPAWRCDAAEGANLGDGGEICHGPFGLWQGGGGGDDAGGPRWYRLPAGRGLPTAPPGGNHCGTWFTGWVSGWPVGAEGQPSDDYATPADGSLPPPVGRPPASGTVCFGKTVSSGRGDTCQYTTTVRAVACGAFVLWELPAAPNDYSGYCVGGA
jgi:hypothetical protein